LVNGPFLFDWDEDNIEHIARHQYSCEEVEEVFAVPFRLEKTRDGRYVASGQTDAGRVTAVVFERFPGRRIRVVTAREMTARERRRYRRK